MEFSLSSEQEMLIESARAFAENELYPHEAEVEKFFLRLQIQLMILLN